MNSRILPSFVLLLSIGIFFAYVNPMWTGKIAEKRSAIAASEYALIAAKEYSARQSQLAAARNEIAAEDLAALEIFLPDSVDNVGLTLDLNALASRSGLSVENIDVVDASNSTKSLGSDTTSSNPIGSVDLSLSVVGTFAALQAFLSGIEKSARLLDVHDLVVTGSDTGVYTYKMAIRLYWLR